MNGGRGAEPPRLVLWRGLLVPVQFPYLNVLLQGRPQHRMDEFSVRHPQMERGRRAKLFAPFDALDGYGDSIREKDAVYVDRITLDDSEKAELNRRLSILRTLTRSSRQVRAHPVIVTATYYVLCTDEYSFACGKRGQYKTVTGPVQKVDLEESRTLTVSGVSVPLDDLFSLSAQDPRLFRALSEES